MGCIFSNANYNSAEQAKTTLNQHMITAYPQQQHQSNEVVEPETQLVPGRSSEAACIAARGFVYCPKLDPVITFQYRKSDSSLKSVEDRVRFGCDLRPLRVISKK